VRASFSGEPVARRPVGREEGLVFKVLLFMLAVFLIATFPATWLLMLFLGNVGVNVSYWGALPLGIMVSVLLAGASARSAGV
jgi:hypothetical protein